MATYPYGAPPPVEQLWREEVLYLHSLWHKGPPRNPNFTLNSNNLSATNSSTPKHTPENLGALNSTTSKKRKNKQKSTKKKKDPKPIVSELELPCGSDPKPCQEIALLNPESNAQSDQATAEEQTRSTGLYLQKEGLKACQDFLSSKVYQEIALPDPELCQEIALLNPESNAQSDQATTSATAEEQVRSAGLYLQKEGLKACQDFLSSKVYQEIALPDPELCQEIGGPESNAQSDQATTSATAEEQARSAGLYLQQEGLKACQDFLSSKVCRDDNEEELVDDDINKSEEFKFLMGIFMDDNYLRDYYEQSWATGEFYCLVCGGTGKKLPKKFKNCSALVQHSTAISKRKTAHRAFGKVVCQVLGWEFPRLPSIVQCSDRSHVDHCITHSMAKAEPEVLLIQNTAQKEKFSVIIDLVDDSDEEVDPKDHGISFKMNDLQVVEFVTIDEHEETGILECSKKKDDGPKGHDLDGVKS